ncbi:MAG: beta-lactamase family protein [Alkaliphilus sp.]|nr:beta-lactamase family protein [Alkaliphilus sp.]
MNNLHIEELEDYIKKEMFYKDMPGIGISITKHDQIIYAKGFGVTKVDTNQPVTPKTIFHMASITKTFVSMAIMQLWELNKIDLSASITEYLPYFKMKDMRYKKITIRQLLSHTSGMPDCEDYEWERAEYDADALERYVISLADMVLLDEPGLEFKYSNIAYEILGDIIAKVTGKEFEDYVCCNILQPLNMFDSTLLLQNTKPEALARPHVKNEEKKVVGSKIFPYNRKHGPSSTLYSNVLDMSRWARVNLNRGELDSKRLLKSSTYDLMWSPIVAIPGEGQEVALGWFVGNLSGLKLLGHEGCDIGFRSSFGILPDVNVAVTVVANANYASTKKIMHEAINMALKD